MSKTSGRYPPHFGNIRRQGSVRVSANIRSDPRWLPFLRKIGKAPEQLAVIKFEVKVPKS